MDYRQLVRRLTLPDGVTAPTELTYGDVVARAITRTDLADDVAGINASLALIRQTRGGNWPTEVVTEEYNYARGGRSLQASSAEGPRPPSSNPGMTWETTLPERCCVCIEVVTSG